MIDEKTREILLKQKSKAVSDLLVKKFPRPQETKQDVELIRKILVSCIYNENPNVVASVLNYFKLEPDMVLKGENFRPLHLAASSGNFEAINDLLRAGANPELRVALPNSNITADFMDILKAQVNTALIAKTNALLQELNAPPPEKRNAPSRNSDSTDDEKTANISASSARSPLLRKRK